VPLVLINPTQRYSLKILTRSQWLKLGSLGLVYIAITQGAMFLALSYLPANMVSLLLNLTSVFVGFAGIFFLGERPYWLQWAGIGLAAIGVAIYFLPFSLPSGQVVGIFIGVFCMFMNVASALLSREINRSATLPPIIVTFVSMGVGSVVLLIIGLVTQGAGTLGWRDWTIIIWMAVINTALAFTLWNHSLQVLTAVESSILNSLMMPQIAILAFLFLGEKLGTRLVIGLVLVGLGTLIVQLKKRDDVES